MLYQIYETQRSLMEPFAEFAQAAAKLFSNPISPLSQSNLAHRVSATYDLIYRLGKDYVKPGFHLHTLDIEGVETAIHERVEIDKPFCELVRFKRYTSDIPTLQKLNSQIPASPIFLIIASLSLVLSSTGLEGESWPVLQ